MKTILILITTILFVSCGSETRTVPEKSKELASKLSDENTLVGNWIAQPGYQNDSIKLIHVDSLYGKMNNIMRFQSNYELDMFDIDGDKNLYTCGNTLRYNDLFSNWKLIKEEGLLYLDIFGGSVESSFHTKKAYKIIEVRKDTISIVLFKTLTDERKKH